MGHSGLCGIVGAVESEPGKGSRESIELMVDLLNHRGPDDKGVYVESVQGQFLGFGSSRLAIIDLSEAGRQPMISQSGNTVLVYNGELYNFKELRKELHGKGYKFRSGTDTEVILNAYEEWGLGCFKRFNGMFALGLLDKRESKIVLARDIMGEKPLYYQAGKKSLLFSSELKSMTSYPYFRKRLSDPSLSLFFALGWIPSPYTIFEDTFKLRPGHYLVYDLGSGAILDERYWDVMDSWGNVSNDDEEATIQKVKSLLEESVSARLVSDVPVGTLLSGGIDSTLVTAMSKEVLKVVRTFNLDFEAVKHSESRFASKIASFLGTNHETFLATNFEPVRLLTNLAKVFDEPFSYIVGLPTLILFNNIKGRAKVILSGDGGDELFWGYDPGDYKTFTYVLLYLKAPVKLRQCVSKLIDLVCSTGLPERLPEQACSYIRRLRRFARQFRWCKSNLDGYIALIARGLPYFSDLFGSEEVPLEIFHDRRLESLFASEPLRAAQFFDLKYLIPDQHMVRVDRSSMFNSIESRAPFLDKRLIEYVVSIPLSMKRKGGTPKYLLKSVLASYVPREMWDRKKQGFGAPIKEWLAGPLYNPMVELFQRTRWPFKINLDALSKLADEHMSKGIDHTDILWSLFIFALWWSEYYG